MFSHTKKSIDHEVFWFGAVFDLISFSGKAKGVVIRIKLSELQSFDPTKPGQVVTVGIRDKRPNEIEDWIQAHQFTNGFSFLSYNTATNNVESAKINYFELEKFDATTIFDYLVQQQNLATIDNFGSVEIGVEGETLSVDADLPSFAQQLAKIPATHAFGYLTLPIHQIHYNDILKLNFIFAPKHPSNQINGIIGFDNAFSYDYGIDTKTVF